MEQQKKKRPILKGILVALGLLIVLVAIVGKDKPPPTAQPATTPVEQTSASAATNAEVKPQSNWYYDSSLDKMRNSYTYHAICPSPYPLDFRFPYNGGSTARITIRKDPRWGRDVMLDVTKGQITVPYNDKHIMAKFDDGPVERFAVSESENGSSDVVFIDNDARFIQKLKAAKRLMVEVPFYEEGVRQVEFEVSGLNWQR